MMISESIRRTSCLVIAALTGWVAFGAQPTNQVRFAAPARNEIGTSRMLSRSLDLTDAQARKLEPVFKEQQARMSALRTNTSLSRQERMAAIKDMRKNADKKMKAHLTPEQLQKMQQTRQVPMEFARPPLAKEHPSARPAESQEDSKTKPAAEHRHKPAAAAKDDKP